MPGFFKANLRVTQAQALLPEFETISVDQLQSSTSNNPRLHRIKATYLYATQPTRKLMNTKSSKNFGSSRKVEVENYNRCVVFGVPGSSTVLALFSANSEETRRLFRYHEALSPGCQVEILKPTMEGNLSRGGTALISTKEPLIPTTSVNNAKTLPPYDVEGNSTEFRFFNFVTKKLAMDSAVIAEDVCSGNVCDAKLS